MAFLSVRGATTNLENHSYRTESLTLVLHNVSVRGTLRYEVGISHFVVSSSVTVSFTLVLNNIKIKRTAKHEVQISHTIVQGQKRRGVAVVIKLSRGFFVEIKLPPQYYVNTLQLHTSKNSFQRVELRCRSRSLIPSLSTLILYLVGRKEMVKMIVIPSV